MNIIDLIEENGIILKKTAMTDGGEWKGKCPFCGGKDRFTAWIVRNRFICRKCKKSGDSIDFLEFYRGMNYNQARAYLNEIPDYKQPRGIFQENEWIPRIIKSPPLKWQEQAIILLNKSMNYLNGPFGKKYKEHLEERGINVSIIKKYCLGFNRRDIYEERKKWGLDEEISEKTGKPKKVWIPRGHIIPMLDQAGNVLRIRVRRLYNKKDDSKKYIIVPGSHTGYMQFQYNKNNPSMIIESELDSMLCESIQGDRVNFYAVGNASARPDKESHLKLSGTKVYFSLDNDDAGKAEFDWWKKQYFLTTEKFCPTGKDPGEFFQSGGNIKSWIDGNKNKSDETNAKKQLQLDKATKPKPIIKPSNELIVDVTTDKRCLNRGYCNFITYKYNKEFGYHRKMCILQDNDNDDSIFDKGCPKGLWY